MVASWRVVTLLMATGMVVASCARVRGSPEPATTSLTVRNRSFFDVDVFAVPSSVARPTRLGTVTSGSTATFPLHRRDLEFGGSLTVEVHAIGARGSWTSDAVAVGGDEVAILDVHADSFGDCSASVLYTILKTDTLSRVDR